MGWQDAPLAPTGFWQDAPLANANANGPAPAPRSAAPPDYANMSWGDVASSAVQNAPASAKQFVMDMTAIVREPVDTLSAIGKLALGTVQKAIPGRQEAEMYPEAVGQFVLDRYMGEENLKRTMATDPVGFMSDLAGIVSGGAALGARAPGMAGTIARGVGRAANVIDPIGAATTAGGAVLSGVLRPEVQTLMRAGVRPTVGQLTGGPVKRIEDMLTSVPLLGDVIGAARLRAQDQFNRAAYNRALNPIGENAKGLPLGSEGLNEIATKLGDAYDDLLGRVTLVPDQQVMQDVSGILAEAGDDLPPAVNRFVNDKVLTALTSNEPLSGEKLKALQSELDARASNYNSSSLASERDIGATLEGISGALRQALERSNPMYADALAAIDEGYANYVRLRNAGSAAGADIVGFSPERLQAAVKSSDRSVGRGDTARGRALMQDLSRAGVDVMGRGVPTSGTTERALAAGMLGTGFVVDPTTALAATIAASPYLPVTQGVLARMLASRPTAMRSAGQAVQQYGPTVGRASVYSGRLARELEGRDQ